MKFFIAFALVVAAAAALPVDSAKNAEITNWVFDNIGVDGYKYLYESSDGKAASEQAVVKNVGTENEGLEVTGRYSYTGTDGVFYEVTYIANEKGFQPQGVHLPK
ncbi:flexible cuticle protein 12-like [Melitaea cinxia]|uniref:flexible cuticle protein 12-like n=1 Tax=Melitaea cinxia TaxID=113334 RepID=UPI001E273269|nr:flexible cuticle protein 12-like [Melitaea cinxia]